MCKRSDITPKAPCFLMFCSRKVEVMRWCDLSHKFILKLCACARTHRSWTRDIIKEEANHFKHFDGGCMTHIPPLSPKSKHCVVATKLAQRTSSIMTVSTNLVETDGMSLKRSWCGTMHMNLLAYQPLFWGKVIKPFNRFSLDVTGDCYHEVFMYQWPLKVELRLSLNLFR